MITGADPTSNFELIVKQQPLGFDSNILENICTQYRHALSCMLGTKHVIKTSLRVSEAELLTQLLMLCGVVSYTQLIIDEATSDHVAAAATAAAAADDDDDAADAADAAAADDDDDAADAAAAGTANTR